MEDRPLRAARTLHLVVAWLFAVLLLVQVFLAGLGVFSGAGAFATHRDFGYMLSLVPIILVITAAVGRLGRVQIGLGALLFVQFILQSVFVAMRSTAPAVAALHPVNGFLMLLVTVYIAREAWLARPAVVSRSG